MVVISNMFDSGELEASNPTRALHSHGEDRYLYRAICSHTEYAHCTIHYGSYCACMVSISDLQLFLCSRATALIRGAGAVS
jgi:hypothetical protein